MWLLTITSSFGVSAFGAYILQFFWSWFIHPFGLPLLSFWHSWGLLLTFGLLMFPWFGRAAVSKTINDKFAKDEEDLAWTIANVFFIIIFAITLGLGKLMSLGV